MTNRVAVYGSLRQGHGNNRLLQRGDAKYICTTKTANKYGMFSLGGFPFVSLKSDFTPIVVEVYEVSDSCLSSLDMLEGYRKDGHSFYNRSTVKLVDCEDALIYHIDDRTNEIPVNNGDWNDYCTSRRSN